MKIEKKKIYFMNSCVSKINQAFLGFYVIVGFILI